MTHTRSFTYLANDSDIGKYPQQVGCSRLADAKHSLDMANRHDWVCKEMVYHLRRAATVAF